MRNWDHLDIRANLRGFSEGQMEKGRMDIPVPQIPTKAGLILTNPAERAGSSISSTLISSLPWNLAARMLVDLPRWTLGIAKKKPN